MAECRKQEQQAIAVAADTYWVGFYDEAASLHCNPYLLVDDPDVVLIDPGSVPHFPIVMRKVIDLVDPGTIRAVVVSHQDPDVCGSLPVVEEVVQRDDLLIAAHTNSVRLVRHYGLSSDFYAVDTHDMRLTLEGGRVLEFIATPFLHSPGAIATYDTKTRTLFSGDLFGAISADWSLFAEGDYLSPMTPFHQAYMPSNAVLRSCIERLERLRIDRICPQHGSVLEGDAVTRAYEHLKSLPCGNDLTSL